MRCCFIVSRSASAVAIALATLPAVAQTAAVQMFGGPVNSTPAQLQTNSEHQAAVQQRQMQAYLSSMMSGASAAASRPTRTTARTSGMQGNVDTSFLAHSSAVLTGTMGGSMAMGGGRPGNAMGASMPDDLSGSGSASGPASSNAGMAQDQAATPVPAPRPRWDGSLPPGVMLRAQDDPACVDYGR